MISASSILEHYIVDLNTRKLENEEEEEKAQDQMPNPNMIKMHDRNFVVFTAYLRESHTSSEEQPEDEAEIKIKSCTYPTVFFYDLEEGKRAWEIFGAEVFLDAVLLPGKKRYDIYYITNEIWWTEDRDEIKKQIGLDKEWSRFEEYSSYIAVLKFGNSPSAALLADKKQMKMKSPFIATKDSYEIAFGQNKTFELTKDDKVVEAFMHNDRKRATVVYRDRGAFTFELRKKMVIRQLAKYYAEFGGKRVDCQIQFKINDRYDPKKNK